MANRGWYDDDRDRVTGAPLWCQLLEKFPDVDSFGVPYDDFPSSPPAPSVSGSKPAVADSPWSPSLSVPGESANGRID